MLMMGAGVSCPETLGTSDEINPSPAPPYLRQENRRTATQYAMAGLCLYIMMGVNGKPDSTRLP